MEKRSYIKDILLGVSVGDALGVPVEFRSRKSIQYNPVTDMIGYGTYNQPPGTWSDDSSLTFCLAESLLKGLDYNRIASNFVSWLYNATWTPYNEVFDVGNATRQAIEQLRKGVNPIEAGGKDSNSNGNGSLMRILPLVFYLRNKSINEHFEIVKNVSSITHGHICSVIACFYYIKFALELISGKDKFFIYNELQQSLPKYLIDKAIDEKELKKYHRIFENNIYDYSENDINSSGYVVDSLEASLWCFMNSTNYSQAVLKAVNLGEDTDTTAAITGGLAALEYGYESIPKKWVNSLAQLDKIMALASELEKIY